MSIQSASATARGRVPDQYALSPRRPNPTLAVVRWELRRALGSRVNWIIAGVIFLTCVGLLSLSLQTTSYVAESTARTATGYPVHILQGVVTRNSLFGLAMLLPLTLVEFGLFLPFVTADGVSLDLKRRTHELLMTSALPTRAYVWGRFLASMLMAVGMAVVYLLALLVVSIYLQIAKGHSYPAINLPGTLFFWAVIALPPTIFVGSVCFALGVLFPQRANVIKASAVFVWIAAGLFLQAYMYGKARNTAGFDAGNPPAWWKTYEIWQPTNTDAGSLFTAQFNHHVNSIVNNPTLSDQAMRQQVNTLASQLPDMRSFIVAHVILVACALLAVLASSLAFRRFRNAAA